MIDLPPPLVPVECDLRDYAFMPIDITRLFGSRFHAIAKDAEWRAGVTLWLKSFHQVPCGSIPDDDVEMCRLAELGRDLKAWCKVKQVALHGWIIRSCAKKRLASAMRRTIFERDDFTCQYCGERGGRLECDHVLPVAKGGKTELCNLVTSCFRCNRSKGALPLSAWRRN